jgi:hypothetical protein
VTPAQLRATGERLYGERWITPLAVAIGRHPMTIYKWLKLAELPESGSRAVLLLEKSKARKKGTRP